MLEAVLLSAGSIGSASRVAPYLGLRNRFELARLLKRDGLPPLHDLANWGSVLVWTDRAEHTGCSLCHLAFHGRRDPAVCYRTVKHVTGHNWQEVRQLGPEWVLERFLARCEIRPSDPDPVVPRGLVGRSNGRRRLCVATWTVAGGK